MTYPISGGILGVVRQRKEYCLPRYPQHAKALFLADIPTIFSPLPCLNFWYPQRRSNTLLNEQGYRADVIEAQLPHGEKNAIRAATIMPNICRSAAA